MPPSWLPPETTTTTDGPAATGRAAVLKEARGWIGTMYKWGGESHAEGGVDCSGLVIDAYRTAGLDGLFGGGRPTAAILGTKGTPISLDQAQPGDVLYFDNPGSTDHVAIYEGNGMMIEAPDVGQRVRETPVRTPTSVRALIDPAKGSGTPGSSGGITGGEGVWDWLNPFDNWSNSLSGDVMKIGLYMAGTTLAGALVVAGLWQTVKGKD